MLSIDSLLVIAVICSGVLYGYFALMRQDAPPAKRKVLTFWKEVFWLLLAMLSLRVFFIFFPDMSPDHFFLLMAAAAGALYLYFKITRRGAESGRRQAVVLWRDIFLCFIAVFIFRGLFIDYFRIPSSSMEPTLAVGDIVLTDKNAFGYRLPAADFRLTAGDDPQRGEVVVFLKPDDTKFYIKRIIGAPGDSILYDDAKNLYINGAKITHEPIEFSRGPYVRFREYLPNAAPHIIQRRAGAGGVLARSPEPDYCILLQSQRGYNLSCEIPPDHYFVLGDNRDNSNDSRFWGFVPRENIVGPAFRVLFNWRHYNRLWYPIAPPSTTHAATHGATRARE